MKQKINSLKKKNQLIESNRSLEERISKIENEFSNLKTTNQEQANKMRQMQEKIDEQAKELERVKQFKVSEIKINSDKEFLSPGSKMKLTATTKQNNASNNDVEWKIEEENSGAVEVESQNGKDFLSSPFLSLGDDDSITCSFKELECTIGSFIPSLYSGRVTINFISFIDNPITIEIETKEKEYQSWFYSTTFNAKDIAKIYISLSNSKLEKDEKFDIEADILISSPGKESLLLPAIFHIVLAPQIIYLSCDKYQLALNKNNSFYLCTEKLISNEEIK